MIIASLHANSGLEKLGEAITQTESAYEEMIAYVRAVASGEEEDTGEEIDYENNPFWAAAKRGAESLHAPMVDEADGAVTTDEMVREERGFDEVKEILRGIDQS